MALQALELDQAVAKGIDLVGNEASPGVGIGCQ